MNIKDVTEGVKEEVAKRVRSPLVGAFIIAWAVLHYEFLFVVFSEGSYRDKNWYLTSVLFHDAGFWSLFGTPALVALVTTALLPLLNLAADLWFQFVDVKRANLKLWIETGRRHSDPELRQLLLTYASERDSMHRYAKEIYHALAHVTYERFLDNPKGRDDMVVLRGTGLELASVVTSELLNVLTTVGFPRVALKMLNLLLSEGELSEERVLRDGASMKPRDVAADALSILVGAKLVEVLWAVGVRPTYRLTSVGRAFVNVLREAAPESLH